MSKDYLTKIRTSISPSSSVEINTTSALDNYATEVGTNIRQEKPYYIADPEVDSLMFTFQVTLIANICSELSR
uniref:(California timema) hypothetical protein n=1 Tax=Timema californicum TaxID=61474 RepID=A0A7R9J2T6_TIMCA|nr:unnamed protein product [Timema californicum]